MSGESGGIPMEACSHEMRKCILYEQGIRTDHPSEIAHSGQSFPEKSVCRVYPPARAPTGDVTLETPEILECARRQIHRPVQ